jgi:hypothetical protein
MFEPKKDEIIGGWRELLNEEFHNLYLSLNVISDKVKEDELGGACSTHGENRNVYRTLVGKPEGKRSLGGPRRRWEDNIKIDLREI